MSWNRTILLVCGISESLTKSWLFCSKINCVPCGLYPKNHPCPCIPSRKKAKWSGRETRQQSCSLRWRVDALQMGIKLIEVDWSYCLAWHLADTQDCNFECCWSFNFHPLPFRSDEAVTEAVSTYERASREDSLPAAQCRDLQVTSHFSDHQALWQGCRKEQG